MPSFKWIFRLGIVLSFAWIAFNESPSTGAGGSASSPLTTINSALANLREKAMASITAQLRSRGIPVDSDGPPLNFATLSAIAQSAVSGTNGQSPSNAGQTNNLQSLVQQVSQLDGQQVAAELQSKFQRLVQETGAPKTEPRRSGEQD
jgi:hypothetical protein